MNNWTTTYLMDHVQVQHDTALYALSAFVAGMAVIAKNYGIRHLMTVAIGLLLAMVIIYIFLFIDNKRKNYT